jgi:hypothetical protein
MIITRDDLLHYAKGMELLGEIVSWNCSKVSISQTSLEDALKSAGLNTHVTPELPFQTAFNRACKNLGQRHLIRKLEEDSEFLYFQFTREAREGEYFTYETEGKLTLSKESAKVACTAAELGQAVQLELDKELPLRKGSDVSKLLLKLLEHEAGLFPVRPQGGCYLVMKEHSLFLDSLESFTERVGGQLLRFPVPAGTKAGDQSVKQTIASALSALINEYSNSIDNFGSDTKGTTLEKAADHIRQARFKVEAYSSYLEDERSKLDDLLAVASERLKDKVNQLAATV